MNHHCDWADGKLPRQNHGDLPTLKETTIDYRSLVVSNRLPRIRLGHHLILPETDKERRQWQTLACDEMNSTTIFFII